MAGRVSSTNNVSATNIATYSNEIRTLENILNEPVPKSKNPLYQAELDAIHATYLRGIQVHLDNALALAEIEVKLSTLNKEGPASLTTAMHVFRDRRALLAVYDEDESIIKQLKDQIIEFINPT